MLDWKRLLKEMRVKIVMSLFCFYGSDYSLVVALKNNLFIYLAQNYWDRVHNERSYLDKLKSKSKRLKSKIGKYR